MRQQATEGIILKRRNSGEADRILTVFTKRNGKITVKASGVRKISSRRAAHAELLCYSTLSLYIGKGMPILTEISIIDSYMHLQKDLKTIGYAYYICELLCELCPENQENRDIFYALKRTLEKLGSTEDPLVVVRNFEKELLVSLGYHSPHSFARLEDQGDFIEEIIEKKLKTRNIFSKLL